MSIFIGFLLPINGDKYVYLLDRSTFDCAAAAVADIVVIHLQLSVLISLFFHI